MFKQKKILALSMLLLIAAPILIFTGFWVKQKSIQYQMNERLEKAALHTITANIADVKWIKKNKEVEIHGRMFDIKHFEINGSQITLTGLYDEEEHELKKGLAGLMKQKKDGTEPLNQLVLKFIFAVTLNNNDTYNSTEAYPAYTTAYAFYNEKAKPQYKLVTTPPPNV